MVAFDFMILWPQPSERQYYMSHSAHPTPLFTFLSDLGFYRFKNEASIPQSPLKQWDRSLSAVACPALVTFHFRKS